jgi:hypothetical protein
VHIIPPHAARYLVLNRARECWSFSTLEEAFVSTKKALRGRGYPFNPWQFSIGTTFDRDSLLNPASVLFVITTDLGDPVGLDELERLNSVIIERNRRNKARGRFRDGAWPGIHCGRRHRGSHHRLVQTTNERTWADAGDDQMIDIGLPPSAAGRKRDLPDSRDDIRLGRQRCWKAYRATQWR